MRLAAIYCVWDDWDMLQLSIDNILPMVDGVHVMASYNSHYGEYSEIPKWFFEKHPTRNGKVQYHFSEGHGNSPAEKERDKRNYGLFIARNQGYTHFLMMDADEFYEPEPFLKEKERFLNTDLKGLVCASQVYFKSPKLTIGLDTTRVTFIHKITPNLRFQFNMDYPFAFDKRSIYIDPTRQLNINNGVEWSNIIMHHYSYIRKDLEKKIRNSTARSNLEKSTIRQDFALAQEGYFCKFYGKTLIRASVDFNIPEFDVHEDLQQGEKPLEAASSRLPGNQ